MQVPFPVLQACGDPLNHLTSFEFIQAFTCTYAAPMGFLVAGLLVWGAVSTSLYVRTGSAAIPVVLLFIIGGVAVSQAAAPVSAVVALLILVVPAGAMALLYYRYSR